MGVAAALGAGAARLLFYPTLLYTALRAQLPASRRPWFHRIDRAVLLGALPLRGRSRRVRGRGGAGRRSPAVADGGCARSWWPRRTCAPSSL